MPKQATTNAARLSRWIDGELWRGYEFMDTRRECKEMAIFLRKNGIPARAITLGETSSWTPGNDVPERYVIYVTANDFSNHDRLEKISSLYIAYRDGKADLASLSSANPDAPLADDLTDPDVLIDEPVPSKPIAVRVLDLIPRAEYDALKAQLAAVTRERDDYRRFYELTVDVDGQYPVLDALRQPDTDGTEELASWAEYHNLLEDLRDLPWSNSDPTEPTMIDLMMNPVTPIESLED